MYKGPSGSRKIVRATSKDLNLIPIMNLFITIIPMLLVITVTVKMAMVEIQMSANNAAQGNEEQKEEEEEDKIETLKLAIFEDRFEIIYNDDNSKVKKIPVIDPSATIVTQRYNLFELDKELAEFKKKNKDQNEITILAAGNVNFDALMASVDVCKVNEFPSINYESAVEQFIQKQ